MCSVSQDIETSIINGNAAVRQNISFKKVKGSGACRSEQLPNKIDLTNSSQLVTPSSQSEHLLRITNIDNPESTPKSNTDFSPRKLYKGKNNRTPSQPKCIYRNLNDKLNNCKSLSSENDSSGQIIEFEMASTAHIDSIENSQKSTAKDEAQPTVHREYQLLAQKFHQYTINCRTTIKTLEKKLKKLIDDKHALLHGMVTLRKDRIDVIKKYRKIFNDAMNVSLNYFVLSMLAILDLFYF